MAPSWSRALGNVNISDTFCVRRVGFARRTSKNAVGIELQ